LLLKAAMRANEVFGQEPVPGELPTDFDVFVARQLGLRVGEAAALIGDWLYSYEPLTADGRRPPPFSPER
jgi:hypothetical protein